MNRRFTVPTRRCSAVSSRLWSAAISPGLLTGRDVLGDDACESLVSCDVETAVATGAVPVAVFGGHGGECALEPDAFGRGAVLDQGHRGSERGHQLLARLGLGEPVDGGHQLCTMQFERAFQQFPFVARERATWAEYGGHRCLLRLDALGELRVH